MSGQKRRGKIEEVNTVLSSHHVVAQGNFAYKARAHCSIVRLAKGRESLGGQRMAVIPMLSLSGCRAFVLDGTKRFHDVTFQGLCQFQGRHQDQYLQAATNHKTK